MSRLIDIREHTFEQLTIIEKSHRDPRGYWLWRAQCLCGNETFVLSDNFRRGRNKSCGCQQGSGTAQETDEARFRRLAGLRKSCQQQSTTVNSTTAPKNHPTLLDIAWAAGLYEGEGSCSRCPGIMVRVSQKDRECLDKLQLLFGGTIINAGKNTFSWCLCGARGRGFIMTIYMLLTKRRQTQIRLAMRL